MPRLVRHAVPASLPVLLAIALVAIGPGASAGASGPAVQPLAAVDWPPSSGLVVGEVMTGGASASDEFVELYNAGAASVDLAGQEVVYVTSTGGTVTRKATWATTTLLDPGRHLLLANTSGVFAAMADATYSGGLAATGGTILVRPVGGAVTDAIGWGDASNAFVEGTAAPAPAAGSSLERRPGGTAGNRIDSNQNLADWLLNAAPVAQNLASPAVPGGSLPTPTPTTAPTPTPTPRHPSPSRRRVPTPVRHASADPPPSPSPTAAPRRRPRRRRCRRRRRPQRRLRRRRPTHRRRRRRRPPTARPSPSPIPTSIPTPSSTPDPDADGHRVADAGCEPIVGADTDPRAVSVPDSERVARPGHHRHRRRAHGRAGLTGSRARHRDGRAWADRR